MPLVAKNTRQRRPGAPIGVLWLACCLAASGAQAGAAGPELHIKAGPMAVALVDFATQARISLDLSAAAACQGNTGPLDGRFTAESALRRLLAHSGCGFRRIDARAFSITPPPRPTAPPRQTTSATVPAEVARALAELVVVATRRPSPVEGLAYAVSSTGAGVLRAQGVRDLNDLARLDPAMTTTNLGMGRDKLLLRGVSDGPLTGLTQSLVGLYLDDTRLTFNAPDPDLRLVDVRQVEVLRGPQGALYGAGSVTGVVRVVSEEPDPNRWSASLEASAAQTRGGGPSAAVDGVINAPLLDGRGALRLVGWHELDGGYIRDSFLNINHANKTSRDGGRVSLRYDLDSRWRLQIGAVSQDIIAADTQYGAVGPTPYARPTRVREPHDNDYDEYHIRLAGDLGWASLHTSAAYIAHNLFDRYDATEAPPVRIPNGPAALDERDHIETEITEESLVSQGNGRFQWLAGGFFAHTRQSSHLILTSFVAPVSTPYEEFRTDDINEAALYGQATERIWRGVSLTVGGRLFASDDHVNSENANTLGRPTVPFGGKADQAGFAPKAVLADQIAGGVLAYVQVERGYRGPGINTAAAPTEKLLTAGQSEPQRFFTGDQLWSYEAGLKITTLGGRLKLNLAGFDVRWKDIQSDQLLPSGLPYTANVGSGGNLGLEIDATYGAGPLRLGVDAMLNDPDINRANPYFPVLVENGLGVVPNQTFGVFGEYTWRLPRDFTLTVDGHGVYVGSSHLLLDIAALPRMGDYATGRLGLTLRRSRWSWSVAVDNPADVAANTFAYGNPFTLRFRQQITPLRPRTVTMEMAVAY